MKIQHNPVEQLEHTTFFTICADLSQYRNLFVTAAGTTRSLYLIAAIAISAIIELLSFKHHEGTAGHPTTH